MPSNEQRRQAAKRKLERQLQRRAERARKRKQLTIAGTAVAAVVAVGIVAVVIVLNRSDNSTNSSTEASNQAACSYPSTNQPSSIPGINPPRTDGVDTSVAEVSISMVTDQGNIGLQLDNKKAPCTVNSFISLASQGFFNKTSCHRLSTSGLKLLQCGDPTASGTGGPGYSFANEYPTNQYSNGDPALETPMSYLRGTIAMANSGLNTNGSQFFLVFGDSPLPPQYTIFGTIDEEGLATLDKISSEGVQGAPVGGQGDGAPNLATTITSVQLD
ncbi:MAG: peptidylprolyl isomerase [Mycobacteriaceae bacterium]